MKLRRKDKVVMTVGRDKGKTGLITRILPAESKIVVEGLGLVKKHTKPSNRSPQGGILEVLRPVAASKVALICPNCQKPTRVGYVIKGDNKERICRKCQQVIK